MTYIYGATIGKRLVGIRVFSDELNQLTLSRIILRELVGKAVPFVLIFIGLAGGLYSQALPILGIIFLPIAFIGYVSILLTAFTKRKQALHDKIAKTVVVYKDPNKKMSRGVYIMVIVLVVLFFLAVIGILASIVLVSLNNARGKAQDAAVKSTVSSEIPAAILYADSRGSFSGFVPLYNNDSKIIACSERPVVNISPDGKNIALFGKLCSDPKKYFCADASLASEKVNNAEVDEQYVRSGISACKQNETLPMDKQRGNGEDNQELKKINTRRGYEKAMELLKDKEKLELKVIVFDDYTSIIPNKLQYIFTTDTKAITVGYDYVNDKTEILDESNLSDSADITSLKKDYPIVSDSIISAGLEGALELLEGNKDYNENKNANPEIFKFMIATTSSYDEKDGQGWKIIFSNGEKENRQSIGFSVNIDKNKVTLLPS